jgi:hypothetical protein
MSETSFFEDPAIVFLEQIDSRLEFATSIVMLTLPTQESDVFRPDIVV